MRKPFKGKWAVVSTKARGIELCTDEEEAREVAEWKNGKDSDFQRGPYRAVFLAPLPDDPDKELPPLVKPLSDKELAEYMEIYGKCHALDGIPHSPEDLFIGRLIRELAWRRGALTSKKNP